MAGTYLVPGLGHSGEHPQQRALGLARKTGSEKAGCLGSDGYCGDRAR